ncbi:MAG: zinc-ribbon domain-containing protein [Oscillospiraceae bacterium]|nr:zinc-ribbon domain-containing protein [Oscillospiraceae bacterium]
MNCEKCGGSLRIKGDMVECTKCYHDFTKPMTCPQCGTTLEGTDALGDRYCSCGWQKIY